MTKTKACLNCDVVFAATRKEKVFCSARCQHSAARKRRNAAGAIERPTLICPHCSTSFEQTRKGKKFCSNSCSVRFNQRKRTQPAATRVVTADGNPTARLFADGFYLGDLHEEIERVRKTPRFAESLEAQLRQAMIDDAVWPLGRVGRIAITLALLKTHLLLEMPVKWRHPHEARRRPGEVKKPTGVGIRAYGRPGSRA